MKKRLSAIIVGILFVLNASGQGEPDDYLSSTFHKERRQALRAMMPPNSVAVFFANPVRNRANDVDYIYHQDPDFYYLSGYKEPHSVLMIFSDWQNGENGKQYQELFFAQAKNAMAEMWTGRRLGAQGVRNKLGIDNVKEHQEFEQFNMNFAAFDKVQFFGLLNDVRDTRSSSDLYDLKKYFQDKANIPDGFNMRLAQVYEAMKDPKKDLKRRKQSVFRLTRIMPGILSDPIVEAFMKSEDNETAMKVMVDIPKSNLDVTSLNQYMNTLRETKSKEEITLLRKAVDVSCVGQIEVMKAMRPDMSETEIQGIHEFVFKKYGAEYEGYPSIVGAGNNGCILHYIENIKPVIGSDLVLMDLGAEYHGYTADVTRTLPADGTFSTEQKAVYNLVLKAQQAGFEECKVGNDFQRPNQVAKKIINEGLVELGIITSGQSHTYFPHGTSHYLGLDVHDRGTYGKFKPNTVITVEPGIYIPDGSPCDKKWWGIAVRIEDDILITEDGWENLSDRAPRSVEEIERMMAQPSALDDFLLPELNGN